MSHRNVQVSEQRKKMSGESLTRGAISRPKRREIDQLKRAFRETFIEF